MDKRRPDGQRPAEKPGAMILDELREQEALSQTREALLARHKTKLSSEFKDIPEEINEKKILVNFTKAIEELKAAGQDGDSQEDGNEGNNANSGEEHGVERKRTLNELRQTKSRYSNSNKGKKI